MSRSRAFLTSVLFLAIVITCSSGASSPTEEAVKAAAAGQREELGVLLRQGVDPNMVISRVAASGDCRLSIATAEVLVTAGARPHRCLIDYAAQHDRALLGEILDRQQRIVSDLARQAIESRDQALFDVVVPHTPSKQLHHQLMEALDAGWMQGVRAAVEQSPELHLVLAHVTERSFPAQARRLAVPSLLKAGVRCDIVCASRVGQLDDRLLVHQLWGHGLSEHRDVAIEAAGLINDVEMIEFLERQ